MTFLTLAGLVALYALDVLTGLSAPKIVAWVNGLKARI